MKEESTRIVLVRHGQTAWNKETRFRGRADLSLDAFGLQQAKATGRYLAERWPIQAIYASPLQRAMQTAEAIAQAQSLSAQPFEGLLDIDYGQWQGRSPQEVEADNPNLLQAWWEAPHTVQMPGGENLDDVRDRVVAGLAWVVEHHTGQSVALVGHTVVNRVLLCAILGLGNEHFWQLRQATCAVNVFEVTTGSEAVLTLFNDVCHLQALAA